uniref:Secreted protein n=1 Tax=Trichuris muris TaxID=70415 RepID=A0A5S6R3Z8_TRIMR
MLPVCTVSLVAMLCLIGAGEKPLLYRKDDNVNRGRQTCVQCVSTTHPSCEAIGALKFGNRSTSSGSVLTSKVKGKAGAIWSWHAC